MDWSGQNKKTKHKLPFETHFASVLLLVLSADDVTVYVTAEASGWLQRRVTDERDITSEEPLPDQQAFFY